MITFLFIVFCIILSRLLGSYYVKNNLDEKEAMKSTSTALNYVLIFLILGIVFINTGVFDSKEKNSDSELTAVDEAPEEKKEEVILTENQKFLQEHGFKITAEFTDSQFDEFKKAIESGLFKEESFCTVFQKGIKLQGKELKSYLKKYNSIPYFEDLLFLYGGRVCNPYSQKDLEEIQKPSYQPSDNVCLNSKDFIKQDLNYPKTADFSIFDCSVENNSDGSYTILRKVSAKNAFGVESEFVYKVRLGFTGGNDLDIKNWTLINMRSEEVK